ncbi:MAG: MFS transporter, partial [Nitrospirota bacterium]|nr:MFS transporter [Nitrospirota bacterium]
AQLRMFLVIGVVALFGGIVFHGTTVALPKIFEVRLEAVVPDLTTIGLLVSLVFAAAALAQIVVGYMLDRIGARSILPTIALLQTVCLVLAIDLWGFGMVVLALPLMLFVFGEIPITAWLVGRYVSASWQSRVFGLQYVLSFGVSALVVPLIALLYEHTGGFAALFTVLAVAAAAVAGVALLLPKATALPTMRPAPAAQ